MDLRGASADALGALRPELGDALSGVPAEDAAATGEGLFAVAATLRSESSLRRFTTDASIPAEAKKGLVAQLFEGKVPGPVLTVLRSAVARRWTSGRDLPDAVENLGVVAHVTSAGDQTSRLVDELFGLGQVVKDTPQLRDALSDPARTIADKAGLLHALLDGKALPATIALATQALSGSYHTVGAALRDYERIAAGVAGQSVATVRVARPLADGESERLGSALSEQYGRPIHLNVIVDPAVLGGVRVEIGDDVIDGTVSARLDDARRRLAG